MKKMWIMTILFACVWMNFAQTADQVLPEIISLDRRFRSIVPEDTRIEKLADGFTWVEGPAWSKADGALFFSDVVNNQIHRWKEGGPVATVLSPSGYTGTLPFTGEEPGSNGLSFDAQGRLVFCQHGDRRISRIEEDGSITPLAARYQGKRLNSPNDLVFNSRGDLYFTDPPFGLPGAFDDPGKELDFQGIYRYSQNGSLTLLRKDLKGPNGIAFSPDEKRLYVSDPIQSAWFVFDVNQNGNVLNKRVLLSSQPLQKYGPGGPDGIKVNRDGVLFTAGPGGIYVISPHGEVLGLFRFGVAVGNCAWGEDDSILFITANTAIYRVRLHR